MTPRRVFLAYLGAVLAIGAGLTLPPRAQAPLVAIVCAVMFGAVSLNTMFFLRARRRSRSAQLASRERQVLAITLVTVALAGLASFAAIAVAFDGRPWSSGGLAAATALAVLAYRVWLVPSASRTGVLLLAMLGAQVFVLGSRPADASDAVLVFSFACKIASLALLALTGLVLDRLFTHARDDVGLPVATLR